MKAVILAGGLGTRLMPLTQVIPKPLLPVGEYSVLEISINRLKECGFDDIIIATNYKSYMFESYFGDGSKFGIKITYSREKEPLATAGPLRLLKEKLDEPFLVIYGDILTSLDFKKLMEFHTSNKADFTLVTKETEFPISYGVIKSEGNLIKGVEEKPEMKTQINAGIYFINPGVLDEIPKGFYQMTDLVKKLISQGKRVMKYELDGYWLDIGQMQDYEKAQKDVEEGTLKI
jgi:NDP-sugar pyrophosphorylase family protein|tara:strand:- start:867 stop:1562 length:696 start_codon:yes stop_codon:yes gene_type:complete